MDRKGSLIAFALMTGVCLVLRGAGFAEDLVVVQSPAGECELSVEANDKWKTLRVRAHHPTHEGCDITRDQVRSILDQAFSKQDPPRVEGVYSSLSIGRMIDFPWLSQYLAAAAFRDPAWDSRKGRPAAMDTYKYVSMMLFKKEATAAIEEPLAKAGYKVEGVTVEKVLVGTFRDVPRYQGEMHAGKVPFDAIVWYRLKKE